MRRLPTDIAVHVARTRPDNVKRLLRWMGTRVPRQLRGESAGSYADRLWRALVRAERTVGR